MNQQAEACVDTYVYPLHGNLYLNMTNRCTLRCGFCPKYNKVWTVQDYGLRLRHEPDEALLLEQIGDPRRYRQVVFCGLGEPTKRLDLVLGLSRKLRQRGASIRLNTDGLANLLHGRDVTADLAACVDEVSISMNAQNAELYHLHCRPKQAYAYEYMLEFVRKLRGRMAAVGVTAIEGLEGVDISQCREMAEQMRVGFRPRSLGHVG